MGRKAKEGVYERVKGGVWYCRFYDNKGKLIRKTTGEIDQHLATRRCLDMMDEARQGTFSDEVALISVANVLDIYHENHGKYLSSTSQIFSRQHIIAFFGDMKWHKMEEGSKTINKYIKHRQHENHASAGTINKEIGLLSAAANWLIDEERIPIFNYAAKKKLTEPKYQYLWITPTQAISLFKYAKSSDSPTLFLFVVISLGTGLRVGEVMKIRIQDINLQTRYLEIPNTKSDVPHEVPMNDDVFLVVEQRLVFINKEGIVTEWLFCHHDGKRIKCLQRSFKTACRRAGIPVSNKNKGIKGFRMHDQRHSFASWLVSNGVPLSEVQDMLNHADIKTTQRYAHLDPNKRKNSVNIVQELIKKEQ